LQSWKVFESNFSFNFFCFFVLFFLFLLFQFKIFFVSFHLLFIDAHGLKIQGVAQTLAQSPWEGRVKALRTKLPRGFYCIFIYKFFKKLRGGAVSSTSPPPPCVHLWYFFFSVQIFFFVSLYCFTKKINWRLKKNVKLVLNLFCHLGT
jgi:hypothetical protein